MKIKDTNFFNKNLFKNTNNSDEFFIRVKKSGNQTCLQAVAVKRLTKKQKFYKRFSDCFGLELRKVSKVCNSKEAKKLINKKSHNEQIHIKNNIAHVNKRIAKANKRLCCLPKIKQIESFELKKPASHPIKKPKLPKPKVKKRRVKFDLHPKTDNPLPKAGGIAVPKVPAQIPQRRHSIDFANKPSKGEDAPLPLKRRHSMDFQTALEFPSFSLKQTESATVPSQSKPKKLRVSTRKKAVKPKAQRSKRIKRAKTERGVYSTEFLLAFYRNEGKDDKGRKIEDMWNYSFAEKESAHNYIQWLFPMKEPTGNNLTAPLPTEEQILILRQDPVVVANMRISFQKMLKFYGMKLKDDGSISGLRLIGEKQFKITKSFKKKSPNWFQHTHNYLRMTRIIKSLRLFGLENEAQAFYKILSDINTAYPKKIPKATVKFWQKAAE